MARYRCAPSREQAVVLEEVLRREAEAKRLQQIEYPTIIGRPRGSNRRTKRDAVPERGGETTDSGQARSRRRVAYGYQLWHRRASDSRQTRCERVSGAKGLSRN